MTGDEAKAIGREVMAVSEFDRLVYGYGVVDLVIDDDGVRVERVAPKDVPVWTPAMDNRVRPDHASHWSEAGSDPIDDLQSLLMQMANAGQTMTPNDALVMLDSVFVGIVRRTMTKRRFRRWRGKLKAHQRRGLHL